MLNTIIIMGRLTRDPEIKATQNGVSVARFSLAVEREYSSGGDRQTDFLDVVAWRNTADFVGKYFHKGQLVAVRGSLQVRSYTDKDGNNRRAYEIVADSVYFAERKTEQPRNDAAPVLPDVELGDIADEDLPF